MKYIIEFEDEPYMREDGIDYYTCKSARWYKLGDTIINRLNPYTEPDRKTIEDEVWNFVDFMAYEMDTEEREECFGKKAPTLCIHELTYQEAKSKYEAWKKQKDEIKVGDEVGNGFVKGTAFYVNETMVEGFFIDDDEEIEHFWWNKRDCKKTDRHFPEVAQLLEKMRGGEE